MMSTSLVSVIVVTFNSSDQILGCVQSIYANAAGGIEVIVVDNASTDDTAGVVASGLPDVTFVDMGFNAGYAAGCNRGAREARGQVLLFLGPDSQLLPGAIKELCAAIEQEGAAVAGLALQDDAGSPCDCWGAFPTLAHAVFVVAGKKRLGLGSLLPPLAAACPADAGSPFMVDYVCGGAMAVRRDVWQGLDGMDTDFFLYFEETEFCNRTREKGYKIVCVPTALATHRSGASFGGDGAARRKRFLQGLIVYLAKRRGPLYASVTRALMSAVLMAEVAAGVIARRTDVSRSAATDVLSLWETGLPFRAPRPDFSTVSDGRP